ncbi:MAG: SpoIIE family protein phosphatase [Actinomycetota bacterium]
MRRGCSRPERCSRGPTICSSRTSRRRCSQRLYGVLDLENGRFEYANAGHNLPYVWTDEGVIELRATGMPLGLMREMEYEEKEAVIPPGATVLLHSDGIAEAHNPEREMFGFDRLKKLMENSSGGEGLIDVVLGELQAFTGEGWLQEDDITLVALGRAISARHFSNYDQRPSEQEGVRDEFTVASAPGNEREAMDRAAAAVADVGLPARRLEQLRTAVAEATMNAIEHGNQNRTELSVLVRVMVDDEKIAISITDHGGPEEIPEADLPDLEAKLAGSQTPRGWGLFLIRNMVDDMRTSRDKEHHVIELIWHLKGEQDDGSV